MKPLYPVNDRSAENILWSHHSVSRLGRPSPCYSWRVPRRSQARDTKSLQLVLGRPCGVKPPRRDPHRSLSWFLKTQKSSNSIPSSLQMPERLTLSPRLIPTTLQRKLICVWDLTLSIITHIPWAEVRVEHKSKVLNYCWHRSNLPVHLTLHRLVTCE